MDRLFLDANVLFSAAYRPDSGLLRLWELSGVELVTSEYAAEEARVNLEAGEQRQRLARLLARTNLVSATPSGALPQILGLPEKDRPILLAAIEARSTHLITGDKLHFGKYFGRQFAGVRILPPGDYLRALASAKRRAQ